MSDDLNKTIGDLGSAFEEFKATHTAEIAEIKKNGVADPLTADKLTKIEADLDGLTELKKQLEEVEKKIGRPQFNSKGEEFTPEEKAHGEAFEAWVRDPRDNAKNGELKLAQKAVATTTDAAGGYAVPEVIGRKIWNKIQDEDPMRRILDVIQVGTSDYKELVDVNGESFGWVGETGTRSETTTPTLAEAAPTMGTIYAYPKATEESLDDMFFNVSNWLVNKSVAAFIRGEGQAFIDGNGTNKPTGFLNGTPTSAGDEDSPARAYQTLQYFPTGVAAAFANDPFASPQGSPGDVLYDAIHGMKAGYRGGAIWTMNTTTKGVIRKWKDADGEYIIRPGLEVGEGDMILGYRIEEMEGMPDIAANAFPVAFGNFREGYLAVERTGLRITVDDNVTTPGYIKWYLRRRVGGIVRNDDAIKLIKCAVS